MDLKIDFATRDHARTPQGWPIRINGAEEAAQNILLRLAIRRGAFRLDPSLGSRLYALPRGEIRQMEAFAREAVEEAVADMPGVLLTGIACRYDPAADQAVVDCTFSWQSQELKTTVMI